MKSLTSSLKSSLHSIIIAAVAVAGLGAAGASASESCPITNASTMERRIDLGKAQELLAEARMNRSEAASLRQMAAGEKLFGNWLDATRNEQRAERLEQHSVELQNEACDLGLCTFRPLVRPMYRPVIYTRPASNVVVVYGRHGRHDGVVVHR